MIKGGDENEKNDETALRQGYEKNARPKNGLLKNKTKTICLIKQARSTRKNKDNSRR